MDTNLDIYEPLQLAGSPSITAPPAPAPSVEPSCQELAQPSTEGDPIGEDTTVLYENVACQEETSVHSEDGVFCEDMDYPIESARSLFEYEDLEEFVEEEENPCDCTNVSIVSKLSQHSYKGGWARFGLYPGPWDDEKQPACRVLNYDDLELTEDEKEGILSDRIVYACSSFLDKNPESQRLTLAKLVAQDKFLCDIQILEAHRYLQYVDLSHNNLRDIWPLSGIPYLMHLDVSHNELTEVLNFKAPWNLSYVDFSYNRVTAIQDLSDFWSLVYLDLSNNRILKIEGLMNLRYLNYLNLSMNAISCFENLNDMFIGVLDISRNLISTFEEGPDVGMHTMVNLSELDISNNRLTTLAIFKGVYHLKVCSVEANDIRELYEIDHMKTLRELSELNLIGNGMTQWPKYRQMVIHTIRTLAVLDQIPVETQERVSATVTFDPDIHIRSACNFAKMQLLEDVDYPPSLSLDLIPFDQGPYPLIVLVGPDGSMKEHLIHWIVSKCPDKVYRSVNHTSRIKTKSEVDGHDYHFVSQQEFNTMARAGTFLYIDELLGDSYGFSRFEVEAAVKQKKLCLVKMEILGALTLKAYGLDPTLVLTITEDDDLHYRRLTGKYRASLIQTSSCSTASMGAVSMGRRELRTESQANEDAISSDIITIMTDLLNFTTSPSFADAAMADSAANCAHGVSTEETISLFEAEEQAYNNQTRNSFKQSVPSLVENMSWLRLPDSRPSQSRDRIVDSPGVRQSRDVAIDNHYMRPSRDVMGIDNPYVRPSRDTGMDNPYIRQSRDVGMDNPYVRQSRDVGMDNPYIRQSRDTGMDNPYIRQSRDVGMDNPYVRQSRDIGMDNPYIRQSRDVGMDNPYIRQSRDVGMDNPYVRQSRDVGIDNSYMRPSKDYGIDNPYMRPSRDLGIDNPYFRQSRDVGIDNSYMRQSRDVGIDNPYLRQSRDVGIDNPYLRQSRDTGIDNPYMRASRDIGIAQQMSKTEDIYLAGSRPSKSSRPYVQFQDPSLGYFNPEMYYRSALDSTQNITSISGVINVVSQSPTHLSSRALVRQESSQSEVTIESSSVSTNRSYPTYINNMESVQSDPSETEDIMSFTKINEFQTCGHGGWEQPARFVSAAPVLTSSEETYIKSIINTRETYFQTHRDNPGLFSETILTDDVDKAQVKFEHFVRETYRSRPSKYPVFNIEEDKSYQSMIAQRLEGFKQEISNQQRTMNKQLEEMAKYRPPRVPPQRRGSEIDQEMQKNQKMEKVSCKLAGV